MKDKIMAKNINKTETTAKPTPAVRGRKDLSNINPELTDAFIQEVDEDVKNDSWKALWDKYGLFVIAIVVIAVSAAVSFDRFQAWRTMQNQRRTQTYMAALQAPTSEAKITELQKISQDNQGLFSDYAKLQIANVLLSDGKEEEALTALEKLANEKQVNTEVKHIALMKLATYRVDTMNQEDFAELLKPILENNNSWTPMAQDLLAMSAIQNGDIDSAKEIYTNLLKVKDLPENFRSKVQDMLSSISDL
jgi:hypothetical protein